MEIDLTERFDEKEIEEAIELEAGEELKVKLGSIPSSGYSWELLELPRGLIVPCEYFEQWSPDSDDEELVGAGGVLTLLFHTSKRPSGSLVLRRGRPWMRGKEDDDPSILRVRFK